MGKPFDSVKAVYAFRYYSHLLTEHERLAYRHFVGVLKASYGRTDQAAQLEAIRVPFYLRALFSNDPQVQTLVRDGYESFIFRTGQRIQRPLRTGFPELLPSVWQTSANTHCSAMPILCP